MAKITWTYFLAKSVKLIFYLIDVVSNIILAYIYKDKKQLLPPITNPILLETASSLAEKIRTKQLKSKEVVQAFISRIKDVNPILNCVIDTCFDEALVKAQEVDDMIDTAQFPIKSIAEQTPFLGVPFTTKDSLAVKGYSWTAGLVSRRGKVAEEDCAAVAMMRKVGAIPIAITNVSELCMWMESSNNLYGRTKNPYDTTRIVGGSSGGEAALIAAAGTPFGIGSDIGGSIRMPAFFNGIFGHKPSKGVVPNGGQFPQAESFAADMLVTGPMCRFTSDLIPMLTCLSGANLPHQILNERVDFKKLKVFYMEDDGGIPVTVPVTSELKEAQQKILNHFELVHDVSCIKVEFPKIMHTMEMWTTQLSYKDIPQFSEEMAERKGKVNCWKELAKWLFRSSDHTLPAIGLSITEKLSSDLSRDGELRSCYTNMLNEFRTEFNELLGDDGILFYPSHSKVAPYHNQPIVQPFNFLYTALFNALQVPVTQCPLGLNSVGLPLGIQVVASSYNDHLTLTVASDLEKAFGGWVCPSIVL